MSTYACIYCCSPIQVNDSRCPNCNMPCGHPGSIQEILVAADAHKEKENLPGSFKKSLEDAKAGVQQIPLQLPSPKIDVKVKSVLGHCPTCGAPIYGPPIIKEGDQPKVTYSCHCRSAARRNS